MGLRTGVGLVGLIAPAAAIEAAPPVRTVAGRTFLIVTATLEHDPPPLIAAVGRLRSTRTA